MNGKQIIALVLGTPLLGFAAQEPLSNLPLQERLKALAERPEPNCETLIAMCYEAVLPPDRYVYLCPTCRQQTVYATEELIRKQGCNARISNSELDPVKTVENMRFSMKNLSTLAKKNGYKLLMDETGLCAECGKGKKANLVLVAVNSDGMTTKTDDFNEEDMIYLTAFFKGQNTYETRDKEVYPLKNRVSRIAELLGLKLD